MTSNQPEIRFESKSETGRGAVVLPCEPEQFRDFIAGLLGRPQTIERSVRGPSEVGRAEIESLYHLLDQRVSSQNEATLIQFTVRIIYDDNSSVLLNSFSDLGNYNEVKPLISTAVHLSWTYLVKFRNKNFPEKQEIDVSFSSENNAWATARMDGVSEEDDFLFRFITRSMRGNAFIRINHTDRTWGTDIDALLSGQIRTFVHRESDLREFVRRHSGKLGLATGVLVVLLAGFTIYNFLGHLADPSLTEANKIVSGPPADSIAELGKQIRLMLQVLINDPKNKYTGELIAATSFSIIFGIVAGGVVTATADSDRPTFILFTREALQNKIVVLKSYEKRWLIFLLSLVGALCLSVLGNYLFYVIVKVWLS